MPKPWALGLPSSQKIIKMENIEKILIALIVFVLTSIIVYLFRIRQLYTVASKLYKSTPISEEGSLYQLFIYNRGRNVEENILLELDPALTCELLASNTSSLKIDNSTIKLDRLHKGARASALLLIEEGDFDTSNIISLSSKQTTGKLFNKNEIVPRNYASTFLTFVFFVGVIPATIYGGRLFEYLNDSYTEIQLESVYEKGWSNLNDYYYSNLRQSYSNQEFPVLYKEIKVLENGESQIVFEAFNKTAIPLTITADKKDRFKNDLSFFEITKIDPMSKGEVRIKLARENHNLEYLFTFKSGDDYIFELVYTYRD